MAPDAHKNFAYSTVATAPSPATSGTSLVVTSGDGTKFPATPFNATIWPVSSQPTTANAEIVRVTGISTDTFTITRAQESSSARTVVVGDQIAATITVKSLTDIETNVDNTAPVTQAFGDAAASGSSAIFARRDHKHGMPATPTTVANDTFWTTKGQIAAATGNAAASALAVGTSVTTQLIADSSASTGLKWVPNIVIGTSDLTKNNNTTVADIPGLSFAIAANERWFVLVRLIVSAASINSDIKLSWTFPTSCTADWGFDGIAGAGQPGYGGWTTGSTPNLIAAISDTVTAGTVGGGSVGYALAANFLNSSNAGTIQLQAAQNTATAENTIFRGSRSVMMLWRLA